MLNSFSLSRKKKNFVRDDFSTSRRSIHLLANSLETTVVFHHSLQYLVTKLRTFQERNNKFFTQNILHCVFKPVLNEEIPVNKY